MLEAIYNYLQQAGYKEVDNVWTNGIIECRVTPELSTLRFKIKSIPVGFNISSYDIRNIHQLYMIEDQIILQLHKCLRSWRQSSFRNMP